MATIQKTSRDHADTAAPAAADRSELVRCESLVIGYQGQGLLPAFDFTIRRGTLLLVVGPNGAGKSTWLKTVLGLIPPVAGKLVRAQPAPRMAYVPQSAALDELLPISASTVVSWGKLRGWSFLKPFARRDERMERKHALEAAGAGSFAHQPFRNLSGGQRQRVLFARLLASDAELVLLDEPTASMDASSEQQAYTRLAELAREKNMAVVVVTHTLQAVGRADEVLFIDRTPAAELAGEAAGRASAAEAAADASAGSTSNPGQGQRGGLVLSGPPATVLAHPRFRRHFGEVELDASR